MRHNIGSVSSTGVTFGMAASLGESSCRDEAAARLSKLNPRSSATDRRSMAIIEDDYSQPLPASRVSSVLGDEESASSLASPTSKQDAEPVTSSIADSALLISLSNRIDAIGDRFDAMTLRMDGFDVMAQRMDGFETLMHKVLAVVASRDGGSGSGTCGDGGGSSSDKDAHSAPSKDATSLPLSRWGQLRAPFVDDRKAGGIPILLPTTAPSECSGIAKAYEAVGGNCVGNTHDTGTNTRPVAASNGSSPLLACSAECCASQGENNGKLEGTVKRRPLTESSKVPRRSSLNAADAASSIRRRLSTMISNSSMRRRTQTGEDAEAAQQGKADPIDDPKMEEGVLSEESPETLEKFVVEVRRALRLRVLSLG